MRKFLTLLLVAKVIVAASRSPTRSYLKTLTARRYLETTVYLHNTETLKTTKEDESAPPTKPIQDLGRFVFL